MMVCVNYERLTYAVSHNIVQKGRPGCIYIGMGNPKGVRRDFEGLERRRLRAVRLLNQGLTESEVARRLKVSHTSVNRWAGVLARQGTSGLKRARRAGRSPRLRAENLKRLEQGLLKGPKALGYETPLWTLWRVGHLIEKEFGVRYYNGHVWKILRQLQWSCERQANRRLRGRG
jgi:transposase